MADVDQCTRCAEKGLCGNAKNSALKIAAIPDNLRNIIFRGKNAAQIQRMLEKFSKTIRESVSSEYGFVCKSLMPSSDNNKDGADLYCVNTLNGERITIEVKLAVTPIRRRAWETFRRYLEQIFLQRLCLTMFVSNG